MRPLLAASLLILGTAQAAIAGLELLMIEQPGCIYCARWHEEVGPEYPITDEGIAAPLRQINLRDPLPEGVSILRPAVFTPTFILLKDGAEAGRIEGYPGEDFFWPMLGSMIRDAKE